MKLYIKSLETYFILICSFITVCATAQQEPQYTQYMYNTMSVNPAYAGSTGATEAALLYRSQWVGISGAPQTQSFSIHSPLRNENLGLGLSIVNDKIGPSDELYFDGNFAYSVPLGYEKRLAFGLKAGARMLNIDWSKGRYYDNDDVLLNQNINNQIKLAVGAGIYYYTNKWYVGLSVPSFLKNNYYDDVQESIDYDRMHFYLMGGYVFDLNPNLKFKPAFLVKAVSGAPITADISANFMIQEKFVIGGAYRTDDSVSILAGFQIAPSFFLGYSFDYTVSELNKYNDGSHEIILRYQFVQKQSKIKSPRFF
ncbi:type IX secretion system PorP/SprF family membrane protein [Flavobacterium nitrogenifigens]|uniref:Type IX secretion system PorP/SprF family membrane protein n=2 Tax=Flavobacterium TaxID=237 RepID=A0A7W7N7I8_9FLAO|nr:MULTISPECIES: type IX secretion system membrane protein PorP/SprF [Flavobacterium]MBB4802940.1 type IX secretion system PorP/SprF family membrane protein [Flavobacterium nitrogenifigens]MBB6387898.1 type IX secretion system PorP/SprF family membrane protein [Flavobacterium notoginsengisoli]